MFSLRVINTDKFLEMPPSTQALYFHLGMRADDDGFVSSPKMIAKIANCGNDDLEILISKNYIIPFESGIIVVADWKENNYIQSDRYRKTNYKEELGELKLENNVYILDTEHIQTVPITDTQDRIGKDRIG